MRRPLPLVLVGAACWLLAAAAASSLASHSQESFDGWLPPSDQQEPASPLPVHRTATPALARSADKAPPEFTVEPAGLIHYLNSSDLVIGCAASGNPAPVITWLHNGAPLEPGSLLDKRYVRYDNSLVISAFKAHQFEPDIHSTTYQCLAGNALGSILSRDVVINGVIDQDYEASVADQFVTRDNDALFRCQLPGQARQLLQVLGWLEDGQPLAGAGHLWPASGGNLQRRTLALPDGRLYVANTRLEDANRAYRCQVRNLLNGRLQVNSISGRLFVTEPDEQAGTAARLVDAPKPLTVARMGEQLLLSCLAQGTPRPHIRWFRAAAPDNGISGGGGGEWREVLAAAANESSGTPLSGGGPAPPTRVALGFHSNLLVVSQVQAQDERSRFRCLANNTYGSQQAETELRLELWPPGRQLELEPRRVYLERPLGLAVVAGGRGSRQHQVTLNCSVRQTGWPLLELEWLRNGRPLFSLSSTSANQSLLDQEPDQELNVLDFNEAAAGEGAAAEEESSLTGGAGGGGHLSRSAVPRSRLMEAGGGDGSGRRLRQSIRWLGARNDALLYQLHIRWAGPRDQGAYQCRARTTRSSLQATGHLLLRDQAPQFVSAFQEALVEGGQGQQVSLRCIASGSPLPELSWTLSGFPVPESSRIRVGDFVTRDGLIVSYVNITNLQSEDGGLYECQANNEAGHLAHAAYLNVTGPPQVRSMGNLSGIAGSSLTVQCPAGGWPIDQISWSHNSTRLPVNHRQRVFPNGTLLIGDLNEVADSGQYTCQARAGDQLAMAHLQLLVRVPPVIEPFSFAKSLARGQRYNIMCTVIRGDLPVSIRWFKDEVALFAGQPLMEGAAEMSENPQVKQVGPYSSTLSFDPIQSRHRGLYTCEAANEAGSANQSSSLVIHVPPEWRLEPKDQSVTVGRTAVINCQADAFPAARIEWRLSQDFEREPPAEFKPIISSVYMRVFENGSLVIYNTQRTDAGHYLCQASNGVNPTLSRVIKLTVHVAAHFKSNIRTELVRRGQPARLRCEALGDPPIEITWLRNKEPMWASGPHHQDSLADPMAAAQGARYSLRRTQLPDGLLSELSITQCDRADSALFTCLTQNQYGNDDTSVQLIVQGPPDAPHDIRIVDYEARSVHISWQPPDSGNSPLLAYQVSYLELGGAGSESRWLNVSVPSNETSVTLQGLSPLTEYQFQLVALNAIGASKAAAQEPIKFRTDDEAPTGPPVSLRAQALSSHSISVRWMAPERRAHYGAPLGFYVGYKQLRSASLNDSAATQPGASKKNTFIYKTVELMQPSDWMNSSSGLHGSRLSPNALQEQECLLTDLKRAQRYAITVQAWNGRGAGPASEPIYVDTWKVDVPQAPSLKMVARTRHSIQLAWQPRNSSPTEKQVAHLVARTGDAAPIGAASNRSKVYTDNYAVADAADSTLDGDDLADDEDEPPVEPILSYLLSRRQVAPSGKLADAPPVETKLPAEHVSHLVEKLQCGTSYQFTIAAQNSVGLSAPSEPLYIKTEGTAPVAPDKSSLLLANASSVAINLAAWHNGACAMHYFELMYRPVRSKKWTSLGQVKAKEVVREASSAANLVGPSGAQINSRSLIYSPQLAAQESISGASSNSSTSAAAATAAAADTVLLEDLSTSLTYELKIVAINEAGSTEALYTFSTQSQAPDHPWHASTDFRLVPGHLAELLAGDGASQLVSWLLGALAAVVLVSGTCVALSRKRSGPSSSSCSLSESSASRSNQSSSCYYTDSATGIRRVANPLEGHCCPPPTQQQQHQQHQHQHQQHQHQQEQLAGEEAPMLPAAMNAHLEIYAPFQGRAPGSSKLAGERHNQSVAESAYACPAEQRHPAAPVSPPHSVELSSMINGSEAEIYLGASALTMGPHGPHGPTQPDQFPKQIRPDQSTFISQPANKLAGLAATMNRSSTLPTNCQEQLIQRFIQQQQQQQAPHPLPAAEVGPRCDSFAPGAAYSNGDDLRLASLLEGQLQRQQQVYATVKRTCPRQARLCDYTIYQCSNGAPMTMSHQFAADTLQGSGACCAGAPLSDQLATCYNQQPIELQQQQPPPVQLQLQQQHQHQQLLLNLNHNNANANNNNCSDYQQLRPVN